MLTCPRSRSLFCCCCPRTSNRTWRDAWPSVNENLLIAHIHTRAALTIQLIAYTCPSVHEPEERKEVVPGWSPGTSGRPRGTAARPSKNVGVEWNGTAIKMGANYPSRCWWGVLCGDGRDDPGALKDNGVWTELPVASSEAGSRRAVVFNFFFWFVINCSLNILKKAD